MRNRIAIIIYANPDYYPPVMNAVEILSQEFNLTLICRNQEKSLNIYPGNVKIYRLGKLKNAYQKQNQSLISKINEFFSFILKTLFLVHKHNCKFIYSYDMYGLVVSFFASRFIRRIPLLYHNLDLIALKEINGFGYIIKWLELKFSHFVDKIIFCDINRARLFKEETGIKDLPEIMMNTPLKRSVLPENKLKEVLKNRGFNPELKVVLYQGTIGNGKALLEVLRSLPYWPEDTVLVLLGYMYRDFAMVFFKEAKSMNLNKRIIYIPAVPYKELFNYTVGAYLGLALYSSFELNWRFVAGASNKIFEYISMGIPPIVNDSIYFREIFSDSMVYFADPFSYQDIARIINLALNDYSGYFKKSSNCRKAHLEKFNYQIQFQNILEFISKKLKNRK
ncbi:MAG: hypothetical protein NC826_05745 [Candidatus Omnitrophica bacterium]|nr:hypothetical protein [Candidatus Omnitrophota bacterium]